MTKAERVLILIYFVLTFFEPYLNIWFGSLLKYYIIFLLIFFSMKDNPVKANNRVFIFFLWFLYQFFTIFWTEDYSAFNMFFLGELLSFALLIQIFSRFSDKELFQQIIITICVCSVLLSILSLVFGNGYHIDTSSRRVMYIYGAEVDPNNQAAFSLFSYIIPLYYIFKVSNVWKAIFIICVAITVISIVNTASRGAIIAIAVVSLFLLFNAFNSRGAQTKHMAYYFNAVVLLLAIIYLSAYIVDYFNEESATRVFQEGYESSDREIIWSNVLNLYKSNLLYIIFGAGWGTANIHTGILYNEYFSLHNTHLAILVNTGIVGVFLFYYPIYCVVIKLYRNKVFLPIIMLIGQFAVAFFLESINKRFFWNSIYLIFAAESIITFSSSIEEKNENKIE